MREIISPDVLAVVVDVPVVHVGLGDVEHLELLGELLAELGLADAVGALDDHQLGVLVEPESEFRLGHETL